ncbi:MAG: hypothetical protein B6247_07705 [Candidatus Parabeggiatoa sp. nov. 2]|nr:MAG: hypothetical protein B6247_07705 [Beggiatoa sp. 4572_84]
MYYDKNTQNLAILPPPKIPFPLPRLIFPFPVEIEPQNDPKYDPQKGIKDQNKDRNKDQVRIKTQNAQSTGDKNDRHLTLQKNSGDHSGDLIDESILLTGDHGDDHSGDHGGDHSGDLFAIQDQNNWLNAKQFAQLIDVKNTRNAQIILSKALKGKTWRWKGDKKRYKLQVEVFKSEHGGGNSGQCYVVHVNSLPNELIQKWNQQRHKTEQKPTPQKNTVGTQKSINTHAKTPTETQAPVELPPTVQNHDDRNWITTQQFAQLAEINDRTARTILTQAQKENKPWQWQEQEYQLRVNASTGNRGRNGINYQVYIPSLPDELASAWYQQFIDPKPATTKQKTFGDINRYTQAVNPQQQLNILDKQDCDQQWREEIVRSLIIYPERTHERTQRMQQIIETTRLYDAKGHLKVDKKTKQPKQLTEDTIYRWIRQYKKDGFIGLYRKPRDDKNKSRVEVTQKWDREMAVYFNEEQKRAIAQQLDKYIYSLWGSSLIGYTKVMDSAAFWLTQQTKAILNDHHVFMLDAQIKQICRLNRRRVFGLSYQDGRALQMLYHYKHHPDVFYDKFDAIILRKRLDLYPLQIVCGDVHHAKYLIKGPDGKRVYPAFICWQDLATNRLFITIKFCRQTGPKSREGVTQADISLSYMELVKEWGIPRTLYLDNGSEYQYNVMKRAVRELNDNINQQTQISLDIPPGIEAILRTNPYEPRAKPIEGLFGILVQNHWPNIRGFVGNKKHPNQKPKGKEPEYFEGSLEEFAKQIDTLITGYHSTPQKTLEGLSPNSKLQKFIDDGWAGKWTVDEKVLQMAFAEHSFHKIGTNDKNGYIRHENAYYRHDCLLKFPGINVEIAFFKHDDSFIFVYLPDEKVPIIAELDTGFEFFNKDGAKERKRRKDYLRSYIELKFRSINTLKIIDILEEQNQQNPDAKTPESPVNGEVKLNDPTIERKVKALEQQREERVMASINEDETNEEKIELWAPIGSVVDGFEFD